MAQLAMLDPNAVMAKITNLGRGRDVALLCFENPRVREDWCHRGQVSGFLWNQLGIEVREFGLEGHGWQHPKLFMALND